jgi:Uncharacterized protein conserved in bacteria
MESGRILRNSQIIILGVCIAVATIIASVILSQGALKIMKFQKEVINVTGSAQKEIKSDYIVWRCGFTDRDANLQTVYKKVRDTLQKVKSYLVSKGVKQEEMITEPIITTKIYKKSKEGKDTNEVEAYELGQAVEIRSKNVGTIDAVSKESTELINEGIQFISSPPQYFLHQTR